MAYDTRRGRVVLFGGARPWGGAELDDTWAWDGCAWRRVDVIGSGARDHVTMTYSPTLRTVVLHGGGMPAGGMHADSWRYDGRRRTSELGVLRANAWKRLAP